MIEQMLSELPFLAVIVFAIVAFLKQLGVKGKALTLASFIAGLLLGLCYRYAAQPMVTFADWFYAAVFGLMAGFLASGAYKGIENATGGAWIKTVTDVTHEVDGDELPATPDKP